MKKILCLAAAILSLGLSPVFAQFIGNGPKLGGAMDKLFGPHQTFSATTELETSGAKGAITMSTKMYFDTGKSRSEVNMADVNSGKTSATALAQMKAMGMDSMISISRPDQKMAYLIYPGLKSYLAVASQETSSSVNPDDYKIEISKLGTETVDGHDCTKNKATVTDKQGNQHEYTVWNATDLKDFPVKITTSGNGMAVTMLFKNISFDKPDASLFEVPTAFTKYDNIQTMMQTEMMKRMGNGMPHPTGN